MSGDGTTDAVSSQVAETVAPGSSETHSHEPSHSGPSNADIMSKLDELSALLTSTVSGATETTGEVTEPTNNEVIRDKSPASTPWTHKKVLR